MTREEIENIGAVGPYCFKTDREKRWYEIGCIEGLAAADEHPNLEHIWHNVSEKPIDKFAQILYQDESGDCFIVTSNIVFDYGWDWYTTAYNMARWVYIVDLLPKGGKK